MISVGTVDQLVTAVTVSSLLCQRTFQADSNPRPHSCLRPACKITMIVLLHCGRGGAGAGRGRTRHGGHRRGLAQCVHYTAATMATITLTGTLLGHHHRQQSSWPPPPSPPGLGPGAGRGRGHGARAGGDHWQCGGGAGVHSVQASPATATLAGHQPPVCCDHRPLVWAMVCGGRARAQPSHQQVGLHHSTPPPPSGAPAPCPPPGHHLGTPPPRLITQCHVSPCHHWPGHV